MPERRLVIFTDLDGTLLDHFNYSVTPALSTLARLERLSMPVVPNSSKTLVEIAHLNQQLGLCSPFIVENGAAVVIPKGYFSHQPEKTDEVGEYWIRQFSSSRLHWLDVLAEMQGSFNNQFEHFSMMTVARVCELTGLAEADARRAMQRRYTEPVLWLGDDCSKAAFVKQLEQRGAHPLQGGRFIHVAGDSNKGVAMQWLMAEFRKQQPGYRYCSVALGDSHNDVAMLEAADIAVRILSPTHAPPALQRQYQVLTSDKPGPAGWAQCIEQILTQSGLE